MLFARGRHENLTIFVVTNGFNEVPNDTIRENSSSFHHFITNNFANVECIHRQLISTDMLIEAVNFFALKFKANITISSQFKEEEK